MQKNKDSIEESVTPFQLAARRLFTDICKTPDGDDRGPMLVQNESSFVKVARFPNGVPGTSVN
jgi:hypothetical protein